MTKEAYSSLALVSRYLNRPLEDWEVEIAKRTTENCKHCYGTGREGWTRDGKVIPCDCIMTGLRMIVSGRVSYDQHKLRKENDGTHDSSNPTDSTSNPSSDDADSQRDSQ